MTRSILRSAAFAVAANRRPAGCVTAAPNLSDPAGTSAPPSKRPKTGGLRKLADYTCAAKKGDFASLFGTGGGLSSLAAAGIDTNTLFDAIKVDFQDLKTTKRARPPIRRRSRHRQDDRHLRRGEDEGGLQERSWPPNGQPADDATIDRRLPRCPAA